MAQVLEQGVEPRAGAGFADLLLHLLDATEFDSGCAPSLIRFHSFTHLLLREHFGVAAQFDIEFVVAFALADEIEKETFEAQSHGLHS
ncbi:MAG TPA: hypothetical protein VJW93_09935 [Candidatus Acidoferrales bacterium]|nr:hypothetical protein [Candidatus Acidoferrales bacterium]